MHQHTSPSLTSKLRKLFPTTVTSSSKILTCLVGNREKNSLQLKNAQKPFKINGFPIQQNVHVCMITTNIDTTWLNQGSILLIHRSYHVVGVYTSTLVITMKARFLPLAQIQTCFSLKRVGWTRERSIVHVPST